MKNLFTNLMKNTAKRTQNTGGGASHEKNSAVAVWNDGQTTVNRQSTDGQSQRHYTLGLMKYAAMVTLLLTLACGNTWGASETLTWSGTTLAGSSGTNTSAGTASLTAGDSRKVSSVSINNNKIEVASQKYDDGYWEDFSCAGCTISTTTNATSTARIEFPITISAGYDFTVSGVGFKFEQGGGGGPRVHVFMVQGATSTWLGYSDPATVALIPSSLTLSAGSAKLVFVLGVTGNKNNGRGFKFSGISITGTSAAAGSTHNVSAVTSTGTNTYGSVSATSSTVVENGTTTITATPAEGYRVSNWAVSGTGASISPSGASHSTTTTLTMGTADATVTVTFEACPSHTITYTNTKEMDNTANPTSYYEGVGIASFTKLRHAVGYDFTGWSPSSISSSATTNQTIDAQWSANAVAEGTGTLTYAFGYSDNTITTSSITRNNGALYDATDLTWTGVTIDESESAARSGKITTTESYDSSKYLTLTFKIADGYTFTPTEVQLKAVAVTTDKTIRFEFKDNAGTPNTKYLEQVRANGSDVGTLTYDFDASDPVTLTGTVTVKIYAYGATNSWRLGTPLTITGTVAAAAPACTAPNHVDISGRWDRFGGETISLTATAYSSAGTGSPIADANITGWQWQKLIGTTWTDVSNGTVGSVVTSGATTKNLQITNCGQGNSGKYRCVVSTGATCSTASATATDGSEGYGVKVYVLECYTDGTTVYNFTRDGENQAGSVTINLSASTAYTFKVHADDYYGNSGTINFDVANWVCSTSQGNLTVNSGLGGTFTFDVEYSTGGNSSVEGEPELSVTYPRKTVYLKPNSDWKSDGAKFAFYYFRKNGEDTDKDGWTTGFLSASVCDGDVYPASIPQWNGVKIIGVRFNSSEESPGWNGEGHVWNQTSDLTLTSNDLVEITGWSNSQTYNSNYAAPTYTISFDGNGETSGSMTDVEDIECDASVTLEANAFVKTGYTFTGWKDGSSNDYVDEATISNIRADIELTAQWSAKQCTVSFNTNGGSGTITSVTATYDAAMPSKAGNLPTKTGYTFAGFFDGEGGTGNQYYKADGTSYTNWDKNTTSTTTLYAKWICTAPTFDTDLSTSTVNVNQHASASALSVEATANSGTITYQWYSNDENNYDTPSPISGATSASYTPSTETAGTMYYFCEAKNTTGGNCTTNSSITPVTVTATYRVVYNGNGKDGGSDVASSSWVTSGTDVTTVANTWTKSGNKFKWWNTENDGIGEDFYVGEKVTISSADVTLYAQWESVGTGEEFWCGIPDEWHATTHDVTVGDMKVTAKDYSSSNNYINKAMGKDKEYTVVSATDKHATVMAVAGDDYYIQICFSDGSTINELKLGVTTDQTSNQNIVVCYSTTDDFSSGEYEFVKVGSTDNVVTVPGHNQSTKSVTVVSPSTEDKYKYVRIYRKLSDETDYNSTGAALGSSAKARIYSIKAKKGTACTSPTIGSQPADVAICPGSTTTLTVSSITGGNTPYTYRWYDASDDSAVSSGSGYTTASFTTPTLDAAASYYCIVTENGGCTTQSETADVTMKTTTAITSGPSSVANAVVGSASSLSMTAEGTNLSYQWYTCDDDQKTNADDIDDETDATLSVTPASVGVTYYYCVVSGDCGTETSDVVSITAKNSISPSLSYASTVTYGSTISPTLSGADDGSVTYSLNDVSPAGSLTINGSTGVVTGVTAGGTATVTATITAGDDYWGGIATSSTITVTKADLSVSATAGTADDITHNSATLPFELSSTDGVGSVTLKVYDVSDDSEPVKTVTGVTAATSGSGEVTGLDANTTYYFTVTPIGDSNHNNGSESDASDEFTTDDAPTLSALVAGTLYKVEDMVPASCTGITGSETYWEGLSDNAKFFLVGSAASSTTMAVKNDSKSDVSGVDFSNSYYFKSAATLSSNTPTNKAIKFIVPTGGGILKVWVRNAAAIKLAKEGVAGTALHASDGSGVYKAYTMDVTAGTWYLYATGGSTTLYGVQLLIMHDLTTIVSGGVGGIVSAASSVAEGGTATVTATPAKGYVVTNWAVSGTGASITPSGASSSATTTLTMGTTDATVTVTFGKANYNVTYDDNGSTGGSEPTDATDYHYGDKVTVSDNTGTMTKTGYTFVGWTYNGTFYQVGDKFVITEDVTLAAAWKLDGEASCAAYVWYNAVPTGKTNTDRFSFTSAPTGSNNSSQTMTIGDTDYTCEKRSSSWNSTFTFSVAAEKIGVLYFRINAAGSTTRTITITNTTTSATTTISDIDDSGYKTYTSASLPAGSYSVSVSATIYVSMIGLYECDAPCYDVSFENMAEFAGSAVTALPDAIENVPMGNKILQPVDPTTTGEYVFGGWYKEETCENAWDFANDKVTGTTTLYAKWYDAAYTVTWKVNGADYATTKACGDVPIVLPAAPADNTLDDCANSFRGWSETNLYGEANDDQPSDLFIDPADAPTIGANKTYYAIFGTTTDAAYVNTVLWSEDWTGESKSATPSIPTTGGGYTILGAGIEYTWKSGDGTSPGDSYITTDNSGNLAGGASPEVILGKKGTGGTTGGSLIISGIPNNGAKKLTLLYKQNDKSVQVSVSGTGYYFDPSGTSKSSNTADDKEYTIICGTDATFTLTFTATTTTAARIDDIVVKVKEDGATDYRCICPLLTVTPELITASTPIFITSAASKTVRSQDSLLIVGSGLDKSATLTLKSPSSKFALKTRTNEALTTDATGAISAVGYIFYTPDAGDTSDDLDKYSTFTVTDGSNDAIVDQALIGRHLPADFVIVAKNGDKWYALPADMSSESNPTPAEIAVDDKDNPTVAYSANTNIYNLYGQNSGAGYLEEAGQYIKLGMKNNSNYPLYGYSGPKTSIKGDPGAIVTNNIGKDYWWLLTQTNTSANVSNPKDARYTIANASNEKTLSAWFTATGGPKWGLYAAGNGEHTLRILPVSSTVGFAEAEIVAWGKNSAIVEVDNSTMIADYAIAKLPEDIESPHVTLSQTRTSVKNTGTRYNYTMDFGEGVDFSANEGKMLTLEWYDALNNFKAVSNIMVPCIVADDITINKSNYSNKSDWNKEVHVLPGVTVTVDASAYTSSNVTIKELVIYPGAKVIAENGTLITPTLVLRNGWNRLTAKTEYNIAQLYITPTTGNLQATNAYADWYIDYDQYYPIAVPWKVATANISYRNMTVDIDQGLIVRYYNGSRHAGVSVDGTSNWTTYTWGVDMPANLEPGIGYAITARRPAGKAFSIIRMPLSIPSNDWTSGGEQGYVSETHKDEVAVTAWAKNDGSTPDHAKGWNFVANPYMASYEGEIAFTPDSDPGEDYEDEIAYVNIPDVNFKEFDQVDAATAELKPGSGVLIQTKYDGKITFATGSRKADAPAYRTTTPRAQKQKAYIRLSGEEAVDQMGLIIADRYTADYELNADLEKLLSDGNTLRTYMQYGNLNMAYVAINRTLAQEWIPVSVRIPATGEYTFSLHEASKVSELEGIYLIDYTNNVVTNLIENNYSFIATEGTIEGRFAINAIVGKHDTPTDIDIINAGGDIHSDKPVKFICRDKVYILNRGVIYDSTGKKVREINK